MSGIRDPNRIELLLNKIREVWEKHPDLRLGQLISNQAPQARWGVFYIEDDELLKQLNADDVS